MKNTIKKILIPNDPVVKRTDLYRKYSGFTMIPENLFTGNLALCEQVKNIEGCIVECGVWKGGMSAAISEVLGKKRKYFLCDGFEGMPPAKEIDGKRAIDWQNNKTAETYMDNCKIDMSYAQKAMLMAGSPDYKIIKGWFNETIPSFVPPEKIAILRLDCDWYDPMTLCLDHLSKYVAPGGLIILDDYYFYDGCSRAVHDFLSRNNSLLVIQVHPSGVPYILNKAQ